MLQTSYVVEKLRELRPALAEKYGLTELALFGSYSRGEQTPDSDIDVMVNLNPVSYKNFLNAIDVLEAAFPGIPVQAVIKGGIKPHYFESIKEDLLYA